MGAAIQWLWSDQLTSWNQSVETWRDKTSGAACIQLLQETHDCLKAALDRWLTQSFEMLLCKKSKRSNAKENFHLSVVSKYLSMLHSNLAWLIGFTCSLSERHGTKTRELNVDRLLGSKHIKASFHATKKPKKKENLTITCKQTPSAQRSGGFECPSVYYAMCEKQIEVPSGCRSL